MCALLKNSCKRVFPCLMDLFTPIHQNVPLHAKLEVSEYKALNKKWYRHAKMVPLPPCHHLDKYQVLVDGQL